MDRFLILFLAFCTCSYAQDSTSNPLQFKRILAGSSISPDFSFRTLKNTGGSSGSAVYDLDNSREISKVGYTAGLNICVNFSKSLGIETGILFSDKGYKTKSGDMTFGDLYDRRRGFIYSTGPPLNGKMVYNYYYIDVPLKLYYIVGKKKLCFIGGVGFVTNIFLKETSSFIGTDGNGNSIKSKSSDDSYKRINLSPQISAGIDWKISGKTSMRIEPVFRYGLIKIIDAPVTAYLWSAGLNISYYLGF